MIIKTEKVKVYHGIQAIEPIHKPVVTVGTFDGLHIGRFVQDLQQRIDALAETE